MKNIMQSILLEIARKDSKTLSFFSEVILLTSLMYFSMIVAAYGVVIFAIYSGMVLFILISRMPLNYKTRS